MIGGGIRNQASESIDFLGIGDPAFFDFDFVFLEGFLIFVVFFEFLALFFARMITKSERRKGKGKR